MTNSKKLGIAIVFGFVLWRLFFLPAPEAKLMQPTAKNAAEQAIIDKQNAAQQAAILAEQQATAARVKAELAARAAKEQAREEEAQQAREDFADHLEHNMELNNVEATVFAADRRLWIVSPIFADRQQTEAFAYTYYESEDDNKMVGAMCRLGFREVDFCSRPRLDGTFDPNGQRVPLSCGLGRMIFGK